MAAEQEIGISSLVEDFVRSEEISEQKKIIENVLKILQMKGTTRILNIVEALGVYLTSEDISKRKKGTQFLAEIIHRLQPDLLNDKEVDLMALFFCDRLQDHHSIQPQVIYGVLGMVSYHNLTDQLIVKICQTMFAEIHVQSLSQADRRNTYNLFSNLLDKNIRALRRMGPDFVMGFIQSMDGEKDPRNLIVCFKNVEKIVAELSFDVFAEDLFEVTSCYFPIDFTPPPNDSFGVSKDELINRLRCCLSSTRKFAEFLLPLLMEKMSSDIVDAKIDSLLTLAAAVLKYIPNDLKGFSEDVWNAIRRDFLLGGIKVLEDSCKLAITNIIKCLEPEPDSCVKFVNVILRDCEHSLKDPDMAIAQQLGVVMHTVVFASYDTFEIAMPRIMDALVTLLNEQEIKMEAKVIQLLQIVCELLEDSLSKTEYHLHVLRPHIIEKLSSFLLATISSTQNGNLLAESLNCLLGMIQHKLLSENEVKIFMDFITDNLSNYQSVKVQDVCFKSISLICSKNLELEKGFLARKLKEQMMQILQSTNCSEAIKHVKLKSVGKALTVSFSSVEDMKDIVRFFLQQLFRDKILEVFCLEILHSIEEIVKNNANTAIELDKLISPVFLDFVIKSSSQVSVPSKVACGMMKIMLTLISHLPAAEQEAKARDASLYYTTERMDPSSNSNGNLLIVHAMLTGIHGSVVIPDVQGLLKWLRVSVEFCKVEILTECGCKTFASVINKMADGETLDSTLEETLKYMENLFISDDVESWSQRNIAMLFLWLIKAIIMKWHKSTPDIIRKLLYLCHNNKIGRLLCENFSILVRDFSDCLNVKMHAKTKLMHKQRFVEYILPRLVEEYKKADESAKGRFLKAISQLLQQLPNQVLQKNVSPLMPLLIRSLSFTDVEILSSTLATISVLDAPNVLKEHVTSLVPRLLSLTRNQSLKVRMSAIKCLCGLCDLPSHVIYPYQKNVIRALKACLDDKKRFVRKEAIKCRNQWCMLKADA